MIKSNISGVYSYILKNSEFDSSVNTSSSTAISRDDNSISPDEIIVPYYQEDPINVSLEEINNLNIIISNCTVQSDFFSDVCQELSRDGIKFICRNNCIDTNIDDVVIITLDQEYSVGENTIIFAPLQNFRAGNSDALVLAAQTSFYEKGFLVEGIDCSNNPNKEYAFGDTDAIIERDANTSFVTVSFGTYNVHAGLTAAAIEATLTRYYSYIDKMQITEDLIYCDAGGNISINPIVEKIRAFNKHGPTKLYIDKTLWSR